MNSEIILSLDEKEYHEVEGMISDLQNVTNSREIKKGKFREFMTSFKKKYKN